jgi:hypothetical protein
MAAVTLGGTNVHATGGIMLDVVSGFWNPAETRGVDTDVPTLAGRIARNRVPVRRAIVLDGTVTGTSASDFASKMATLFALCDPTTPNTLAVDSAYLGASKSITVRYVNSIVDYTKRGDGNGPTFASVNIEFESITPDWS